MAKKNNAVLTAPSKQPALQPALTTRPLDFQKRLEKRLFASLDNEGKGSLSKRQFLHTLRYSGILDNDPRLNESMEHLQNFSLDEPIALDDLIELTHHNGQLIQKVLQNQLIIPDFKTFCEDISAIYDATALTNAGKVADYIPQLARVSPDQFGVSLCTIDGQRFSRGDTQVPFSIQSTSKTISYCIALEEHGNAVVHNHIGFEPSGKGFNELTLNSKGLPHNPMINAGAIMSCSLIQPQLDLADRFDYVMDVWTAAAGGQRPGFNNAVYLSERHTADRNFALGYFMRENKAFPEGVNLIETLEFYFQCCSIEATAELLSVVAGTLANGGICPITGLRVLKPDTVKNCLSLMYSCGMYDYSGEFAFTIGLPAKSGVSGVVMLVVPNVMGLCIWSPRLDQHGNSVHGIEFSRRLVERYNFHNYDSLVSVHDEKTDPRLHKNESKIKSIIALCWAAAQGDLQEVKHLYASGVHLDEADYDGRTALHLAASEGQIEVIEFLIRKQVSLNPIDRWGGTPLADAHRHGHTAVVRLLEQHGGTMP